MASLYQVQLTATCNEYGWEQRYRSRAYIMLREKIEQGHGIVDRHRSYPPATLVFILADGLPNPVDEFDCSKAATTCKRFEGVYVAVQRHSGFPAVPSQQAH